MAHSSENVLRTTSARKWAQRLNQAAKTAGSDCPEATLGNDERPSRLRKRTISGFAGAIPLCSAGWHPCCIMFRFAGRFVHEAARTMSKTLAREAERQRRRELEQKWNRIERRTLPPRFEH